MDSSGPHNRSLEAVERLLTIITTLRSENGCPWDRKQTPETFHPYILEEYHELVQAIREEDPEEIVGELGDLIFLVVFVACMYEQQGLTTVRDIVNGVADKMVRRHPHVFGNVHVSSSEEVIENWSRVKASEESIRKRESLLDGIPRSLPALKRAQKLARRAAKVRWEGVDPDDLFAKIDEELAELKEAAASGSKPAIREELGDLLFVITNAARRLDIDGETALAETGDKFERRFRFMEDALREEGISIEAAAGSRIAELWDKAKEREKVRENTRSASTKG